ncbi:MAG: MATE family efflux transporter [Proteobacteria bacterium]|nr:MATE family efflux transporter [Pseudomonadota bacterium]
MSHSLQEPTAAREIARLWRLAWPVSLGMVGLVGMGTTDTILVGQLGDQALAALAIGNIWTFSMLVVALGTLRALDPVVSQAFGAGDQDAVGRALVRALGLAAWLVVPLVPWYLLAGPGLTALGQPEGAVPIAASYCMALIPGLPFTLAFSSVRTWLQGFEVMRPATIAILAANVLNIGLDLVLIHGAFGWEGMGAVGSGIATALCNLFMFAFLLWLVRDRIRDSWPGIGNALSLRAQWPLVALGVPLGLQMGLEVWAFNLSGIFVGWLGETELAAHSTALNLASLTFMYALGLSQAGATRVGNLIGAGLPWRRSAILAVAMGGLGMSVSATVFWTLPYPLASIYTPDEAVRQLASTLLPIAAAFQIFDGLQVTMFGVLRGAGDIRIPTLANVLGYWMIGLPVGLWLTFPGGYGAAGVWWGLVFGLVVVCFALMARLRFVLQQGGTRVNPDAV